MNQFIKTNLNINNINSYLYFLMAFLMPINKKFIPIVMVLIFITQLFNGWWLEIKKMDKKIWILYLLYLLYLIGLSYTTNFKYGLFDMQIKLPLLLFPLIFAGAKKIRESKFLKQIIIYLIAGTLLSSLICLLNAVCQYYSKGDTSFFSYNLLSVFHHPSYAALFVCLSCMGLFWLLFNEVLSFFKKSFIFILLAFFVFYSVMLSSKAGFISLIIVFLFAVAYLLIIKRKYLITLGILLFSIIVFYSASKSLAFVIDRITEAVSVVNSNNDKGGTADRMHVWKSSIEIIKRHPLIGVGTGDVKDSLISQYKINGYNSAYEKKLNAHNQYLQTFVTLGIFGILSLLILLFYPLWISLKNKDYLYFTFTIVFAFNIAVESMFEVQAGVMFFAFFNSLFFVYFIPKKV